MSLINYQLVAPDMFPAEALDPDSESDAFVLALALAYNDLKDIHWMLSLLEKHRPTDETSVNPELGEWSGMRDHATRMSTAINFEILKTIEAADKAGHTTTKDFHRALGELPSGARKRWRELVALSRGEAGTDPVRKYLLRVRNNFSAHYYEPKALMQGFRQFFFEDGKTPFNQMCYLSLGRSMGQTRFFFADATVQTARMKLSPDGTLFDRAVHYFVDVNAIVRNVVESYVALRIKQHRKKLRHGSSEQN